MRRRTMSLVLVSASACLGDSIVSVRWDREVEQPIRLSVGQKLDIDLQIVGGYTTPTISAPVVRFIDEETVGPTTPGSHVQRFHFVGNASGRARIVFQRAQPFPADSVRYEVDVR